MKWKDYKLLFDKLIPETLGKIAPDTRYWPCSPHSPVGDRNDDANPDCGDAHLWSVWFGRQPFEWYRTAFHRFCSEFGFQSFPEPKTVNGYTAKGDRNVTSPVMEHHQRSGIGNAAIIQYMLSWFRMPDGFDNTLWLSQIQHGLAMKYAVEHWRRNMPRCMGALYWQINDCWPVASWASIDYHGRWKALHYMAKRFFAPVLLSGVEDLRKKTVDIHLTSDRREKFSAKILWKATTAGGNEIASGSKTVTAKPLGCAKMMTINLAKEVEKYGEDIMVWLTLEEGKKVIATDFVTLVRPKRLNLSDPELAATVSQNKDGSFAVKVKTAKPALWAWLELSKNDAKFSDNFFCLEPGKETEITVIPF
jgi:beta-mannosidase